MSAVGAKMISREIQLPKKYSFFLFGPRQTGKTTLVRSEFPNALEINLLETKRHFEYLKHPELLTEQVLAASLKNLTHIFIDEVQRVPVLLDQVHELIERFKASKKSMHFILSGSSARKLKRGAANLLGGRALSFHLHPFTFREFGNSPPALNDIINFGTLPPIFDIPEINIKEEFLRSYVETYLKEEVVAEALTRNLSGFLRFLQSAGEMNGEQINHSGIARDVSLSHVTVKEYFMVLQDTMIGFFLQSYSQSERKRHKISEKFYFFDTGVVRALQESLSSPAKPQTFAFGKLFETWIINEVRRFSDYHRKDFRLSFLRAANDVEVDLIIETPQGKLIAIEIKSKPNPSSFDYESGFKAIEALRPPDRKLVVCTAGVDRLVEDVAIVGYSSFLNIMKEF